MNVRARSQWMLVALPACCAALLFAVVLFGWLQSQRSAALVLRGEADLLLDRANEILRGQHERPTPAGMRAVLEGLAGSGITYVAVLAPGGEVQAAAGSAAGDLPRALALQPGDSIRVGHTAWVRSRPLPQHARQPPLPPGERPPPPRAGLPNPGRPEMLPGPEELPSLNRVAGQDSVPAQHQLPGQEPWPEPMQWPPLGRAPSILLAFEPRLEAQIDRAALATLIAGCLAGVLLLALSAVSLRLLRARDAAQERLESDRRLASLGTMSAVVAHELRNALGSLKGHAQLVLESLEESHEELLDAPAGAREARSRQLSLAWRVVDGAMRLEQLGNSLLELARTGTVAREPVSPAALIRSAAESLAAPSIRFDDARAPASWPLDPIRFRQVIANLVENALQAAPDGEIELRAREESERLIIEVRDHGPGVPAADRERIFEPFVTGRAKGIGLGLAVSRQLVALHGGTLTALDAPGGGALFRIELPAIAID